MKETKMEKDNETEMETHLYITLISPLCRRK